MITKAVIPAAGMGTRFLPASKAVPNPVQPDSALGAIRFTIGLLPAIVAIIAMAIFWRYPLTDERFREIRNETEYRKRQQGHLIAPDGHVIEVREVPEVPEG